MPKRFRANRAFLTAAILGAFLLAGCADRKSDPVVSVQNAESLFRRVSSAESGVTFNNTVEEKFENYFDFFSYVYNGGGVAIGDVNNDGLPDLYFTGNEVPDKLYLNKGGLKFEDITTSAGIATSGGWHNGVTMVDINHDGQLDIYVCRGGWQDTDEQRANLLYINQGDLSFKESAAEYGIAENGYSMQASFFDMDNDNDLDMFVANRPDSFYLSLSQMQKGRLENRDKNRDKLYVNENGKFKEVGLQSGIVNNYGYALGIVTADVNNDGLIDIFVANDYAGGDYLYINQGNGKFKDQIQGSMNHTSLYSMGVDISDINNDGLEDIMVMEMRPEDYKRSKISMPSMDVEGFNAMVKAGMHKQYMHNMLHLNQGNLAFSEVSQLAGIAQTDWSWAVLACDFNNSGDRDLLITNGYRRDVFDGDTKQDLEVYLQSVKGKYATPEEFFAKGFKGMVEVYKPVKVRNYLFRNNGNLKFENVSEEWGFHETSFSNGAAVGDLDGDGDLDVVVNNLEDEAFVFENKVDSKSSYLKVRLKGPEKNTFGLGGKITLYTGSSIQYFENKVARGYLSSSEPIVHFGLGQHARIDSIKVRWNDGKESVLADVAANQVVVIDYTQSTRRKDTTPVQEFLFREATNQVFSEPVFHKENEFNEYKEQVLLPHMFSRSGPFMSVADVNNDNQEDVFVGGAAGSAGQLFLQKNGKLVRKVVKDFEQDKSYEDIGALFFDANQDSHPDLYVVSGGSEFREGHELYQDRLYINDGSGNFARTALPKIGSSGSCVVANDINGDGKLDLFVGGMVTMGAYPKAPRSYLLINEGGKFSDKTNELAPTLAEVGMVKSAIWTDLTGDGVAELVVVGEWMAVKVFENEGGKLNDISDALGLAETHGWWNSVAAEDLNGDGRIDLVLGNQGDNYKFKPSEEKPLQVFAKDFDGNNTNDIFLAKMNKDTLVPVRGRECTSVQMPMISQKFPSFRAFAGADLNQILGPDMANAMHLKATIFSSIILINEGNGFKKMKLPVDAQFSAINSIIIEDFNEDGHKDILIAGNKFDSEVETTPADASQGLLLLGLGNFEFRSVRAMESGFFVPYNVKDTKRIKLGKEWATLVSSNNDLLRVFKQTKSKR